MVCTHKPTAETVGISDLYHCMRHDMEKAQERPPKKVTALIQRNKNLDFLPKYGAWFVSISILLKLQEYHICTIA